QDGQCGEPCLAGVCDAAEGVKDTAQDAQHICALDVFRPGVVVRREGVLIVIDRSVWLAHVFAGLPDGRLGDSLSVKVAGFPEQAERLLEACERLVVASCSAEGLAEVLADNRDIGISAEPGSDGESLLKASQCLFGAALGEVGCPDGVERPAFCRRVCEPTADGQRLGQTLMGGLEASRPGM